MVVSKALVKIYNCQISSFFANNIFVLLKIKADISKMIIILMTANKNLFWKKQALPSISLI